MSENKNIQEKFEDASVQVIRFEGRITITTSGCCEGCIEPGYHGG